MGRCRRQWVDADGSVCTFKRRWRSDDSSNVAAIQATTASTENSSIKQCGRETCRVNVAIAVAHGCCCCCDDINIECCCGCYCCCGCCCCCCCCCSALRGYSSPKRQGEVNQLYYQSSLLLQRWLTVSTSTVVVVVVVVCECELVSECCSW
jgi:hypothetical protein